MRYIGKVCRKHPELGGERYASSRSCIKCVRETKIRWQLTHPEYKHAPSKSTKAKRKQWRKDNHKRLMEINRKWRAENRQRDREKILAQRKQWRAKNPEKLRVHRERYRKNNLHKVVAHVKKRQLSKLNATPKWANQFFIEEIYDLAQRRTKLLGYKWHVDHIVPLRSPLVCGLHVENNLQVIPARLNLQKHNRTWPNMPETAHG